MSLNRLKTLLAVKETGSFVGAAERVHLTPAAVGQQIKHLEQELGVQLFDRHHRTPQLSPIGNALLPKARELIALYDNMVPSLLGENAEHRELGIGAVPSIMSGLVPRALAALREQHSRVHFRVVPGLSTELLKSVDQGFLDAAVITIHQEMYTDLEAREILRERYVLLAPKSIETGDPREILESQPFVRFNRHTWVGQQIDQWLRSEKIRVVESMELDTLESIASMVQHNLGVAIVPEHSTPPTQLPELQRIPLGPSIVPRILGLISHPESPRFHLVDELFDTLVALSK
ncbi:MAG: LysR family transcriptional regulator [Pseudomonadota bacterium]